MGRFGHVRNGALALALTCEAVLAVFDALVSDEVVFTSAYVLAPVALAITGRWRQVAIATWRQRPVIASATGGSTYALVNTTSLLTTVSITARMTSQTRASASAPLRT